MIGVILRKELLELRRSPTLLLSMISLPATVVAVPVALFAWLVRSAPEQALAFIQELYGVRSEGWVVPGVAAVLARNWLPMFLILPIFLPILLAAQSIGGERERRTLEPLLALLVVQLAGKIALGPRFYFGLAAGIAAADVALICVAVRLFDRERLLTTWR